MILQMFDEDKTLSRERLCEKTSLSDGTIKREIAYLKSIGAPDKPCGKSVRMLTQNCR